jgi:hypothetical protein
LLSELADEYEAARAGLGSTGAQAEEGYKEYAVRQHAAGLGGSQTEGRRQQYASALARGARTCRSPRSPVAVPDGLFAGAVANSTTPFALLFSAAIRIGSMRAHRAP